MLTVHQVADHLLLKADGQGRSLDHMKLQKLCYYAQGFHLGLWGKRLFEEDLRAWAYGPVTRELWDRFRYRRGPLPLPEDNDDEALTPNQRKFLEIVLARFGEYPSRELSRMTHAEDPWREAYERSKQRQGDFITDESLARWFRPRIADLDTSEAPPPPSAARVLAARKRAKQRLATP